MPSNLVPDFLIKINGSPLSDDQAGDIASLIVYDDISAPSMAEIQLQTFDRAQHKFKWVDESIFAEGNPITVSMGYVDSALKEVFSGEIIGIELDITMDSPPMMLIRAFDRRHRLMRGRKTRTFTKMKDSEIASKIASETGLSGQVTDTSIKHDYVLQHNQSDIDFLRDRAERIGYEVLVTDRKLVFRPIELDQSSGITLDWESDLIEFYARTNNIGQVGKVAVRGWDVNKKEAIISEASRASKDLGSKKGYATADSAFGSAEMVSTMRPLLTKAEGDKIASGQHTHMSLSYMTAEGLCEGRTDLITGKTVEISNMGKRFSGDYYLTEITYSIRPSEGFLTAFTARRNATNG
ncbi:MAG: hypothetical protein WBC91_24290 [Phototrophicaceae bacterium]